MRMTKTKITVYASTLFMLLALLFIPITVRASEKDISIDIASDYKKCEFKITFENAGTYDATLISASGEEYPCSYIDENTMTCEIDKVKKGEWTLHVSNAEMVDEIGKVSVTVSASKEDTTNVVDDIKIGKDISGLNLYFRDRTIVVEWTDDTCGNVDVKVVNQENDEILGSETVAGKSYELDIPSTVKNIVVSVVPTTSAKISGATQNFTFAVDTTVNGTVTFPSTDIVNTASVSVDVSLASSYGFYVTDNGEKVYEEDLQGSGDYTVDVDLVNDGDNEICFYLVDENGNMYSTKKTIVKDVVAPTLSLDEEYNGLSTYDSSFTISGTVTNFDYLYVNDEEVSVATDGKFSYNCTLHLGSNNIVVLAKDKAGNETSFTCTITMLEEEKGLSISQILPYIGMIVLVIVAVVLVFLKKKKIKATDDMEDIDETIEEEVEKETKKTSIKKEEKKEHSKKEKKKSKLSGKAQNNLLNLIIITLAVAYMFLFVIRIGLIQSGSMYPTIATGDITIDNAMAYVVKEPQRGDIISFYSDELKYTMCKRVIGVAGDTITFKNGYVYLNGEQLDESAYLDEDVETNCLKEFEVPSGYVFCLGDNRENSLDSRYWNEPYIKVDDIKSKLMFVIPTHLLQS